MKNSNQQYKLKPILIASFILISSVADTIAQAQLRGSVKYRKSNKNISNAVLSVLEDGKLVDVIQVDENGDYEIDLEEGSYDLVVSINGESSAKRKNIVVQDDDVRTINFNVKEKKDSSIGKSILSLGKSLAAKLLVSDGMDDFKEGVVDDLKHELAVVIDNHEEDQKPAFKTKFDTEPTLKAMKTGNTSPSNFRTPRSFTNDPQSPFRNPLSSFGLVVNSRSWMSIENSMNTEKKLNPDSVRVEELYNNFGYDYPKPSSKTPFKIVSYLTECPWNEEVKLLHIGVQGRGNESIGDQPKVLAQDLDVFVEFNPAYVDEYRLVGNEGRKIWKLRQGGQITNADHVMEDFNVTALYEITPAKDNYASVEERILYQKRISELIDNGELANIRLKYRSDKGLKVWEIKEIVNYRSRPLYHNDIPDHVRHAAAMAQLGLILNDSDYKMNSSFENVAEILETMDSGLYESSKLIELTKALNN